MKMKSTETTEQGYEINPELNNWLKRGAKNYNESVGNLHEKDEIICPRCNNRGGFLEIRMVQLGKNSVPYEFFVECECMLQRVSKKKAEESGLKGLLKHSFDNFVTQTPIQKEMKKMAMKNANTKKMWFYIGGMTGSGKSHICSAICKHMLNNRHEVKYSIWLEDFRELNFLQNDRSKFKWKMRGLKEVSVLYIDDLFKTKKGVDVSNTDVQMTFEIINYRYNNNLKTIISSELTLEELVKIDEAVAGRIAEKAGEYILNVDMNPAANYRFRT